MGRSGTGLGLAIVWSIVHDHSGYIDVETSMNEGTAFKLFFPITRDKEVTDSWSFNINDYMANGETILVIDDVHSQREISRNMLERLGYSVQTVASGEEAIEYIKNQSVNLLLIDMIMEPGINSYETYKRIIHIHPNQKAIIVSGFSETSDVKKNSGFRRRKVFKKTFNSRKVRCSHKR